MKLLSIALLLLPVTGWCQQNSNLPINAEVESAQKEPQATLLHRLPNEGYVYALPQDGMPCVVPPKQQIDGINRTTALTNKPMHYNMPVLGLRESPLIPGQENHQRSFTSLPKITLESPGAASAAPHLLPDWRDQLPELQKKQIQP